MFTDFCSYTRRSFTDHLDKGATVYSHVAIPQAYFRPNYSKF